jgi:hypothetical protein
VTHAGASAIIENQVLPELRLPQPVDQAGLPSLRVLQARMLFPGQGGLQRAQLTRWAGEDIKVEARWRGLVEPKVALPLSVLTALPTAPSPEEIAKRHQQGIAVGEFVHHYFRLEMLRPAFAPSKLERFKRVYGDIERPGQSLSWFENTAWPGFRSVGHFWAAEWNEIILSGHQGSPGPRTPESFGRFLALAAWIGEWGCQYQVPGRPTGHWLLDPKGVLEVPEAMVRPLDRDAAVAAFGAIFQIGLEGSPEAQKLFYGLCRTDGR